MPKVHLPEEVRRELERIKQQKQINKTSLGLKEMAKYSKAGREIENISRGLFFKGLRKK